MGRLTLLLLIGAFIAVPLSAEVIADYEDSVYLRDHETVRYRLGIDYGTEDFADVDIFVRGLISPPRVRIVESDGHEVKERRDTDGDWILDFDFEARLPHQTYYIELDSAHPGKDGDFDIFIRVNAEEGTGATADIEWNKFFFDYESGDESDHYDCAARTGTTGWPLAALGAVAFAALYLRQRRKDEVT